MKRSKIEEGAMRLAAKLKKLDVDGLDISEYNKFYLKKHQAHLDYNLKINGLILENALQQNSSITTICDYGAGTGLLGFLAQESWGCNVVYTDIYPSACKDLPVIAAALDLKLFKVVEGDIETLNQLKLNQIEALVSRDVIEHIYDLKSFFNSGYALNPDMIQVHNTAANVYNILRKKEFKKIHHNCEWVGDSTNLKETDTKEAFYAQRVKIIADKYPYVSQETRVLLATNTRGLAQLDIENAVDAYLAGEEIGKKDKYPFNTCDPTNGNWAERLLFFEEYAAFAASNYNGSFTSVPYNISTVSSFKKIIAKVLNTIISSLGNVGRYIWPSFNLILTPKSA
jgi:hypothetical protein